MDLRNVTPALVFLGVPGLVYAAGLGGLAWALRRRWGAGPARAFWLAAVLGLAFLVGAVGLFGGVAAAQRRDPVTGGELQGAARLGYVQEARRAFVVLYAAAVVATGILGAAAGRRAGGRTARVGLAAAAAVLLFEGVTLGLADFLNACLVGQPFVVRASC